MHNCVYFACKILEGQINLLEHLDRPTLAYLVENPRLESFCPDVRRKVNSVLVKKKSRHNSSGNNNSFQSTSVRFQPEKDSKGMFPDAQTFQDFKKQRDLFYELVRNWIPDAQTTQDFKKQRDMFDELERNSKAHVEFSSSVTKLLTLQQHPINMKHFAR